LDPISGKERQTERKAKSNNKIDDVKSSDAVKRKEK
jgi:hypothetical protein